MNVLIYSGPEVVDASLSQTTSTLRTLLFPNYSVQCISKSALESHPWTNNCAALVFPACRQQFTSTASDIISNYIDDGGLLVAFSSGSRYSVPGTIIASATLSNSKDRPLRFLDKSDGASLHLSYLKHNDNPRTVSVKSHDGTTCDKIYENGKGDIAVIDGKKNVSVLARYTSENEGRAEDVAAASYSIGSGTIAVLLLGFEYSLVEAPASLVIAGSTNSKAADEARQAFIGDLLRSNGLDIPLSPSDNNYRPLPQFLVSKRPEITANIVNAIHMMPTPSQPKIFQDSNDIFHFHTLEDGTEILRTHRKETSDSLPWQPKHIAVNSDGKMPDPLDTPLFNLQEFFDALSEARNEKRMTLSSSSQWGVGEVLLYGEVVTSTQTMLDKNQELLRNLPTPLVSLASHQLSGRGRGSNLWLSPSGCLQFSILLRLPLSSFPATKMVFIQYIAALAIIEACCDESVLGEEGAKVRIKWPNDLYAVMPDGRKSKIGGILVNTSFSNGMIDIVIGCGVNILNPPPITSLSQLASSTKIPTMEHTAACIFAHFEALWETFVREKGSFDPFMDRYLRRWLHSDQSILLTSVDPPQRVRIVGITSNYGLLRTIPEKTIGRDFIDLQPDGNSFDLMTGMIKSKAA